MATLKAQLVHHLFGKDWINKGEILDIKWYHDNAPKKYLQSTVDRELRSAEEESQIAVKEEGVSVSYKYLPEHMRDRYIPVSSRSDKAVLFKQ